MATDYLAEIERIGPAPGHDPVDRLRHTLKAFDASANEDTVLTATSNVYGDGVWTGITYGDLREILRRLDDAKIPWEDSPFDGVEAGYDRP